MANKRQSLKIRAVYIQRRCAFHFLSCFLWKEVPAPASASTTHTPGPSAFPECPLSSGAVPEVSCESVQTACACRPPPLQPVIQQSTKGTVSSFLENLYIRETMSPDHRWRQEQVSIPGSWQHSCLWGVRVKDVLFGAGTAVAGKSFNTPPFLPTLHRRRSHAKWDTMSKRLSPTWLIYTSWSFDMSALRGIH